MSETLKCQLSPDWTKQQVERRSRVSNQSPARSTSAVVCPSQWAETFWGIWREKSCASRSEWIAISPDSSAQTADGQSVNPKWTTIAVALPLPVSNFVMDRSKSESPIEISSDSDVTPDEAMAKAPQIADEVRADIDKKRELYLESESATRKAYEDWLAAGRARGSINVPPHITGEPAVNLPSRVGKQVVGGNKKGPIMIPSATRAIITGEDKRVLQQSPIQPPFRGEPPKPTTTEANKRQRSAAAICDLGSKKTARIVSAFMDSMGIQKIGNDDDEPEAEVESKVPGDQPHEQDLEKVVKPEVLRTGVWSAPLQVYRGFVEIQETFAAIVCVN